MGNARAHPYDVVPGAPSSTQLMRIQGPQQVPPNTIIHGDPNDIVFLDRNAFAIHLINQYGVDRFLREAAARSPGVEQIRAERDRAVAQLAAASEKASFQQRNAERAANIAAEAGAQLQIVTRRGEDRMQALRRLEQ